MFWAVTDITSFYIRYTILNQTNFIVIANMVLTPASDEFVSVVH